MILNFDEATLNSSKILREIDEKSIYEYYLNTSISTDKLIKCCFHKDSTPSLGFYLSSSKQLIHKCFGCGVQGNVFDFVKRLNNCNYGRALKFINDDLINKKNNGSNINNSNNSSDLEIISKIRTEIIPTFRSFGKIDFNYWNSYHLPLDFIYEKGVRACQRVYIKKKTGELLLFAEDYPNNPIYCYIVDDGYKIYRPLNPTKSGKWAGNTDLYSMQGMSFLKERGDLLIITSSMKDVLSLTYMGYNAIAPNGEGVNIPEKIMDYLWASFDNIVLFYDNDKAGLEYSSHYSEQLGVGNIYIPIEFEEKDISDYNRRYGLEAGKNLMKQLL